MTDATRWEMRDLHRVAAARLAAEVSGRGLHLLLIIAAQRTLGPALFGHFTFAVAVGVLAAVVTDWGTPPIVTREIARRPDHAGRVAGGALGFKLALTAPAIVVIVLVAITRPPDIRPAAIALGLATLAASFVELGGFVLRGLDRVHDETRLLLLMRLVTFVLGALALWSGGGLLTLAVAYLISAVLSLAAAAALIVWRGIRPALGRDARTVVRAALPLGAATVLSIAYVRTPVFVLDAIRGAADVGVYGVAQRLTEPLAIVPAALMAAAFPAISRDAGRADTRVLTHTVKLLALAGAGVLVAGVLLGPAAIDALYGSQFPNAGVALQLLAAATLPVFVNHALTHGLIARGRPDLNLILNAVIFAFNLAICWTLAPRYGVAGAAAAILASEILLLALCSVGLRRGPGAIDAAGAS